MTRVRFVGDGGRDQATAPDLVVRILETHVGRAVRIDETFVPWARLHGARGYAAKLKFAALQAVDAGDRAVVALVDRDRAERRSRLDELDEGRSSVRTAGHALPIVLGQADPHGEAWLIADESAVRRVLDLSSEVRVDVSSSNPKAHLEALHAGSRRSAERPLVLWMEIAREARLQTLEARKDNGFCAFADEVRANLVSLA